MNSISDEDIRNRVELLRQQYAAEPQSYVVAMELAQLYGDLGWFNDALDVYRDLMVAHGDDYALLLDYGNMCVRRGMTPEATTTFEKLTRLKPSRIEGWNNLGIAHLNQQQYQLAREAFEQVLALEPDNAGALLNFGNCCHQAGELERAAELFTHAVEVAPDFADGWFNLGNVHREIGNLDKAIESYKRALRYKDDFSSALKNLGYVYEQQSDFEQAEVYYLKALEANRSDASVYRNLGMVSLHVGRLEEARDYFLSAVRLAPREMAGWMGLRQLSFLKGDVESYVKSTLAVLPRLEEVAIARTCANLRYLDRLKQRDEILEQCDEMGKKGDELDAERLLAYQGRADKAASLPVLEMRLCAIEQPSDMLCMSLATYFGAQGQSDKARQWLGRMREQTPRSRALCWDIALQSGIFEKELPALKEYLTQQPDDYEAWFALARMQVRIGDRALAREALIRALENGFSDELRLESEDIRPVWEEFLRAGEALVES